ncbi:MAG: carotenoid 1,2-hydratase [Burkholderiaceae bacterium]|jgi:predicted secreted hydrolase|nr:carotenoid 1,2-hydratase [Burkholderiaceae bacterium]
MTWSDTPRDPPLRPPPPRRRALLLVAALPLPLRLAQAEAGAAFVHARVRPRLLAFPRDHGAHPDYRTEWWYLTGWLDAAGAPSIGFQVTFFRVRTPIAESSSRFSPTQLVIAHAAIADPARGALLHDERVQRAGFGLVEASTADTDVRLDRWRLRRDAASGAYLGSIPARSFGLEFSAQPTQPLLLQGVEGYSRKGPGPEQASHYYTQPQLTVQATLRRDGVERAWTGRGWLDHEWSSSVLDERAAGWDWIGMNLDDGSALTAFQIRPRVAGPPIHTYASLRAAGGSLRIFGGTDVAFEPLAQWRSPRTNGSYAVAQRIRVGDRVFETRPLMNDQELDSRASTGAVYWEGASTLLEGNQRVGRGYLEMTGLVAPMRL